MNIPQVRFSYQSDDYDQAREVTCRKLTEAVGAILNLPNSIIIQFAILGESVYGETAIDFRFKNRVRINNKLSALEIPGPLVHELIHVNQVHLGLLKSSRTGVVIWKDKPYQLVENMSYSQHQTLPWEVDVTERHDQLLKAVMKETDPTPRFRGNL